MPAPVKKKRHTKKRVKEDVSESPHLRHPKPKTGPEAELALERTISRILLHRFEYDIARLFSTHIHCVALTELPRLIQSALIIATPGWIALNANSDDVKDFFRGALALDLRQAGERVATKSVLWSYTAIRHFAVSHEVPLCGQRGLHSHLLLPFHDHMRVHLKTLERGGAPVLSKPYHLSSTTSGLKSLETYCTSRVKSTPPGKLPKGWLNWKVKIKEGYDRMVETLWEVAQEFDVRGYGLVLREKLTDKWCCLGCLGTVCEPSVRSCDQHKSSAAGKGKEREWDGRGAGVIGWETENEEDSWKTDLDFGGLPIDELDTHRDESDDIENIEGAMSVGELMEWRYIKAEREKEKGNAAFKRGDYRIAVEHYEKAHSIEAEIPHYQLNLAAAHLKLGNWMQAEKACGVALRQQKSTKAYWRRARARKMMGRLAESEEDLRSILVLQPSNEEALIELASMMRTSTPPPNEGGSSRGNLLSPRATASSPASSSHSHRLSPTSSKSYTGVKQPDKLNDRPIPFEICDTDRVKLKIQCLPLTINIDPAVGQETFSYPSWDRYQLKTV
ncbi:uncharacterized protein EI90DRAFT_3035761 [Cantharellus anzutake]|uniref:uncharacterized protein n=1 Tax=Cantharellus anzutake TaxID=1750568 RepID=UPI001903EF46|nr:uncharacterized protein EI90DRAFT_3035761 [Cantharellus anzutake]KAF8340492.1 hypothetical protein EI90DRAFT_3035761 [Cantharellus anzutake]